MFHILSNRRRRYVLHYLKEHGGESDVRSLSERIAAWENGRERERVTPKERKRVYTALHQSHLPRLARAGVVRYDPDRGTVELTEAIAEFDVYLDVVPRSERNWGTVYLAPSAHSGRSSPGSSRSASSRSPSCRRSSTCSCSG